MSLLFSALVSTYGSVSTSYCSYLVGLARAAATAPDLWIQPHRIQRVVLPPSVVVGEGVVLGYSLVFITIMVHPGSAYFWV